MLGYNGNPIVTWPGRKGHLENYEKKYIGKIENLKTKRQTKKIVRSFLSIVSSRYVAQFLDHLEHSGYAIVRGEKKSAKIFRYETKLYNGNPYSKLPGAAGIGESIWWFSIILHEFSLTKMFSWSLPTYIDAKFHGESISDGFRAIQQRKVCQKSKKPEKSRQTRFSGQPSLSIIPGCHCRLRAPLKLPKLCAYPNPLK